MNRSYRKAQRLIKDRSKPKAKIRLWKHGRVCGGWLVYDRANYGLRRLILAKTRSRPGPNDDRGCCGAVYWCPDSDDYECGRHGGFDVCCSHPENHRKEP